MNLCSEDQPMHNKSHLQTFYAAQRPPWGIDGPQKPFVAVADQIGGSILDAGCGPGENALWLASRGKTVTGIDFVEEAIQRAKQKVKERGLSATFLTKDAMTL